MIRRGNNKAAPSFVRLYVYVRTMYICAPLRIGSGVPMAMYCLGTPSEMPCHRYRQGGTVPATYIQQAVSST